MKRSSLSALDRTLGLIFGLARGALLVVASALSRCPSCCRTAATGRAGSPNSRTAAAVRRRHRPVARLVPESLRKRRRSRRPRQKLDRRLSERAARLQHCPAPARRRAERRTITALDRRTSRRLEPSSSSRSAPTQTISAAPAGRPARRGALAGES